MKQLGLLLFTTHALLSSAVMR